MRFGQWIQMVFVALFFFVVGMAVIFVIFVGGGGKEASGAIALWAVIIGLAIMFGGPWMIFRNMKSGSTCDSCGKKWSLEKDGYRDGDVTELHERDGAGDLKLVHKWDRYQDYKCKRCGDETTRVIEMSEAV